MESATKSRHEAREETIDILLRFLRRVDDRHEKGVATSAELAAMTEVAKLLR